MFKAQMGYIHDISPTTVFDLNSFCLPHMFRIYLPTINLLDFFEFERDRMQRNAKILVNVWTGFAFSVDFIMLCELAYDLIV